MSTNIAIVDDNEKSKKIFFSILSEIEIEENISLNIIEFFSPIDYLLSKTEINILIFDSLFKSCPLNLNSIALSKIAKEKNINTKTVLVSKYTDKDFLKLILCKSIDYYTSKRIEENKLKDFLKIIIKDLNKDNNKL